MQYKSLVKSHLRKCYKRWKKKSNSRHKNSQAMATILCSISLYILSIDNNNISLNVQVVGMRLYGIGRMMLFGMFFTNIGKRFGYNNYGSLAGLGLLISTIVSLLKYPMIVIASSTKKGNESLVNLISATTMAVTGLPYCLWLWYYQERNSK